MMFTILSCKITKKSGFCPFFEWKNTPAGVYSLLKKSKCVEGLAKSKNKH